MDILPDRKMLRLKGFDYSNYVSYFVTICSHERKFIFGDVTDGNMILNQLGQTVFSELENLHSHYDSVEIENFVVMPNHIHILLSIISQDLIALENEEIPLPNNISLPQIIRHYKAGVSRNIRKYRPDSKIWQKSYHDRIVRNEFEYETFYKYIIANPAVWDKDCHNPISMDYNKWSL